MKRNCKKEFYWIENPKEKWTTTEWPNMPVDWTNISKLENTVFSYFFRYDNYQKGKNNNHIMRSVFGNKDEYDILKEIDWWFNRCIGVYNEIRYYNKDLEELSKKNAIITTN